MCWFDPNTYVIEINPIPSRDHVHLMTTLQDLPSFWCIQGILVLNNLELLRPLCLKSQSMWLKGRKEGILTVWSVKCWVICTVREWMPPQGISFFHSFETLGECCIGQRSLMPKIHENIEEEWAEGCYEAQHGKERRCQHRWTHVMIIPRLAASKQHLTHLQCNRWTLTWETLRRGKGYQENVFLLSIAPLCFIDIFCMGSCLHEMWQRFNLDVSDTYLNSGAWATCPSLFASPVRQSIGIPCSLLALKHTHLIRLSRLLW